MRVCDPVQQQQERRLAKTLQEILKVDGPSDFIHSGDHPLVTRSPGQPLKAFFVHRQDANTALLGHSHKITQPRIAAACVNVNLPHALGMMAQTRNHRVKTEQQARVCRHSAHRFLGENEV
jgi:hypothetical protein